MFPSLESEPSAVNLHAIRHGLSLGDVHAYFKLMTSFAQLH